MLAPLTRLDSLSQLLYRFVRIKNLVTENLTRSDAIGSRSGNMLAPLTRLGSLSQLPYRFVRIEDLVTANLTRRARTIRGLHAFLGVKHYPEARLPRLMSVFEKKLPHTESEEDPQSKLPLRTSFGTRWANFSADALEHIECFGAPGMGKFGCVRIENMFYWNFYTSTFTGTNRMIVSIYEPKE
eukprot:1190200-Prorocentrum_minimum.AAC.1